METSFNMSNPIKPVSPAKLELLPEVPISDLHTN